MSKIILVDDDEQFRAMLRTTLLKLGHQVRDARDGDEAMRLAIWEDADILIVDIILPGKAGLEIIEMFKIKFPQMRIIAMSGAGRVVKTNYLKLALAAGATAVLDKPFSTEELTATIARVTAPPAPEEK